MEELEESVVFEDVGPGFSVSGLGEESSQGAGSSGDLHDDSGDLEDFLGGVDHSSGGVLGDASDDASGLFQGVFGLAIGDFGFLS